MKMQRVTWIDSCTHTAWNHYTKDELDLARCTSVGIRVPSSRGTVALAGSRQGCQIADVITIPRSCVKKIETLKVD